mmetsp:Transcript_18188/g.51806  ORF Transcript_18188/g.51806 Transcript_18188/m.51806 type:complete len:325 (+) Transcript_18188:85-1059(+)
MLAGNTAAPQYEESIDDIERQFELNYDVVSKEALLGEGTYGRVYKAKDVRNGKYVAMKKMKLDAEEEGVPSTAIREIALLRELNHENVVKLLDVFCSTKKLVLVFEFVQQDLKKYMRGLGGKHLDPKVIKSMSFQLCRGTEFCHANRILHRDLKPQNLLIDTQLRLKLADFGLARAYSVPVPKYTHEVITVWYRAPEILMGSQLYSVPVDMWSVGCIVAEMATGSPLFAGDSEIDTIFKIFQKLGTPTVADWPKIDELPEFKASFPKWKHKGWENIRNTRAQVGADGVDILEKCMVYDPSRRISARRAMQHVYFADVELPPPEA